MKIIRYFSFFLVTILILPIIYLSFFFDSESFKNSIADNISNKISGEIRFDNKIDLTFFPYPKMVLNNLSYFDKNQQLKELQMEETLIINKIRDLDFKNSLLSDNLDLDYIETLIRERFLFGKENEQIYIIKNDTKN